MSTVTGDETPDLLISAFPQGKFGWREWSKHANKPADSNFPLSVTVHFNKVDGLMPHFSNNSFSEHRLSRSCLNSAHLTASVMVTQKICFHIVFLSKCLCRKCFFPLRKAVKAHRNNVDLRLNSRKHKRLSVVADHQTRIELQGEHLAGQERASCCSVKWGCVCVCICL